MPRPSLDEIFASNATAQKPSLAEIFGEQEAPRRDNLRAPASAGRTMLDQGLQGATFGFADELMDPISAGIASVFTDLTYDEAREMARQESEKRLAQQFDERPGLSVASNIGGALFTGGALSAPKAIAGTLPNAGVRGALNAIPKAGQAIGRGLRSGGTTARVIKGATAGATSGAAYGAGSAQEGERLEGAGQGAFYGAVAGGAIPAVGSTIGGVRNAARGAVARGADQLDESLGGIRAASNAAYQKMRDSGAVFTKGGSRKIISEIDDAVRQSGPLNKRIHGNSIAVLKDLRDLAKKGKLGLEELDQYRQLFGDMAGDIGNKPNARLASIIKGRLDDTLDNLDNKAFHTGSREALDALKAGRAEYARARKFEMISDVIRKSEGDPNYVKRELTKILNHPKKSRGFTQEEKLALKQAARLSGPEAVMKIAGKFGLDPSRLGSGVGAAFGSGAGGVLGGPAGAVAVPAVGTAAKYGLKLSTRGKAEQLLQTIERGGQAARRPSPMLPQSPAGVAGGITGEREPLKIRVQPSDAVMPRSEYRKLQGGQSQTDLGGGSGRDELNLTPDERAVLEDFGYLKPVSMQVRGKPARPGNNGDLLQRIAFAESSGNPNARAQTSSASGLFQFTDPTWRDMVKRYGKETGIKLRDKNDPQAQEIMAEKYMQQNRKSLSRALGREPTGGELYIAHFAGAGGARKLLKANPRVRADKVLPRAADDNKPIFYDGRRARTVGEVLELLKGKVR